MKQPLYVLAVNKKMKTHKNAHNLLVISIIAMIAVLLSCKQNDTKKIDRITKVDTSASQFAKNLKVDYTENGKLVYTMSSPEMKKYVSPVQKTQFPKGFYVIFYDSLQNKKGYARANYALSHDDTKILELYGNVIIDNKIAKRRIETEKMFWDRTAKTIYGDRAVRVITPEKVVKAGGFKSTEDMSKYEIIHPTGTFYIKEY